MSITINAKGTSVPHFKIGKSGVTIYQGSANPYPSITPQDGDYWLDSSSKSIKIWTSGITAWATPSLGELSFSANTIEASAGNDLNLMTDVGKSVVVNTLDLVESLLLADNALLTSSEFITTSTTQVAIDSISALTYRSAKYEIQISSGTNYHVLELRILHNGTSGFITQYGQIITNESLGTFTVSLSSNQLNLLFTASNASTTVKFTRTAIKI